MRFERLRVPAFGTLRDFDTGDEGLGSLVVVHGPNESGKSTFFEAITSVLYGFSPASRDGNPFAPWSGMEGEIAALLRSDDGIAMSVRRRLLKSPNGQLTVDGEERAIRNRPLAAVEGVPRGLFREVFALTLAELAALSTESWDQLQEGLLSHMGARDIVAARTVAGTLEDEASSLWRPNRRGSQQVRELQETIRECMESRREAEVTDRRVRELTREGTQVDLDLRQLRNQREQQKLLVERATILRPLQRRLTHLEVLEAQARSGPPLAGVPTTVEETTARLEEELVTLQRRRDALATEQEAPQESLEQFSAQMKLTLELRQEIVNAADLAAQADAILLRNAQVEQSLSDLDRRIATAARELFSEALDEHTTRRLKELPLSELASRVDRWIEARTRAEEAARRREVSAAAKPATWEPVAGVLAWIAAAGLLTLGGSRVPVTLMGGVLLAVGAGLLWRWAMGRRRRSEDEPPQPREGQGLPLGAEHALAQVHALLEGLPFRGRDTDRAFVAELRRLQELVEDRQDRQDSLAEGLSRIVSAAQAVTILGERLELELPTHIGTAADRLDRHLTRAERAEESALGAQRELARIQREMDDVEASQAEVAAERQALLELLAGFGDGDPTEGARMLALRQKSAEDADRLRTELEREHPDLEDLVDRIRKAEEAGEAWLVDEDALAAAGATLDDLSDQIETMAASAEGISREIAHLVDAVTTDQIDGEVQVLRESLLEARRDRDRMVVLAEIIRRADRNFREKNDPDVIEGAGAHLSAITRGRYVELIAPEADPSASLRVIDPDSGSEVPVEYLSTGTREQVYFSLRLAIMDRLDAGGERLPVLVDEAFVNWDQDRRSQLMGVLQRLGETRQVFVFTCHREWAEGLRARGGRLVELNEEAS
jgi:uncharacterized protein YhaN